MGLEREERAVHQNQFYEAVTVSLRKRAGASTTKYELYPPMSAATSACIRTFPRLKVEGRPGLGPVRRLAPPLEPEDTAVPVDAEFVAAAAGEECLPCLLVDDAEEEVRTSIVAALVGDQADLVVVEGASRVSVITSRMSSRIPGGDQPSEKDPGIVGDP